MSRSKAKATRCTPSIPYVLPRGWSRQGLREGHRKSLHVHIERSLHCLVPFISKCVPGAVNSACKSRGVIKFLFFLVVVIIIIIVVVIIVIIIIIIIFRTQSSLPVSLLRLLLHF